jgi:uncharacterized membrane protein YgcG
MTVDVHYTWLATLHWTFGGDDEVAAIGELYAAVDPASARTLMGSPVQATEEQRTRWLAASEAYLAEMTAIAEERRLALRWWLRWCYRATIKRLRRRALIAHRNYRDSAGDLTEHVAEPERRRREEQERQRILVERQRTRRANALRGMHGAGWTYRIVTRPPRLFEIALAALARGNRWGPAVTAPQVQEALSRERAEHPLTVITWEHESAMAMAERNGTAVDAWYELTGVRVVRDPAAPEPLHKHTGPGGPPASTRHAGPSSSYWSPSGFDGGGGHSGSHGGYSGGHSGGYGSF